MATHRVEVPAIGGSYTEALVGEPQLINPLYAPVSDVDADLTRLVYSGLMKWDPVNGLEPDLASAVFISEDGKTYTLRLRDHARFHNGSDVRARDVLFTIQAIQNPAYRSPLIGSFRNITAEQVDDRTMTFTLKEPNAAFLSALTVGILPAEIWADVPAKNATHPAANLAPVGSGPYQFAEFSKDQNGAIKSYTLKRSPEMSDDQALIETLIFKFYPDAEAAMRALQNKNVEGVGFVPANWRGEIEGNRAVTLLEPDLQRQVTLFFNMDAREELKRRDVRHAIALAIDKLQVVQDAASGRATVTHGPILPSVSATELFDHTFTANRELAKTEIAKTLPAKEGAPRLALTLTTVQSPEFAAAAESIAKQLQEIDVQVEIEAVEPERFFSAVIEPRAYELLLSGALLGAYPDPYPFWHSSQKDKGALNLANYGKRNADTLIEEARRAVDPEERTKKYRALRDLLDEDVPAVFLYQSTYTYAVSSKLNRVSLKLLAAPADRFGNIEEWYLKTKKAFR